MKTWLQRADYWLAADEIAQFSDCLFMKKFYLKINFIALPCSEVCLSLESHFEREVDSGLTAVDGWWKKLYLRWARKPVDVLCSLYLNLMDIFRFILGQKRHI